MSDSDSNPNEADLEGLLVSYDTELNTANDSDTGTFV